MPHHPAPQPQGQQQAVGRFSQEASPAVQSLAAPPSLSEYEILGKIGEGTYGVVYLARGRDSRKKLYAIKTFKGAKVSDLDASFEF